MVVKALGIGLIMFSSVLMGTYFAGREGRHISALSEFIKALAILKSEIEFALTPLPEALKNISEKQQGQVGLFFLETGQRLSERDGCVAEIWRETLNKYAGDAHLDQEDLEHMTDFGNTLGYLDKGMQLCNINILEDYFKRRIAELTVIQGKNKKVFGSLGVLCGLLAVIVFI